MKLCHVMGHKVDMITYVQIFKGPAPPEIWEGQKVKTWPDFGQLLTLTVNILRTNRDIKNLKQA